MARVYAPERIVERHLQRQLILLSRSFFFRLRIGLPLARARGVMAGIDQNPAQPGPDAGLRVKRFDAAVQLEERLLHRVLRVGAVPQNPVGDALQASAVRQVDLFEGPNLTPAARRQQFGLVGILRILEWVNQRRQARFDHSLSVFDRPLDGRRPAMVGIILLVPLFYTARMRFTLLTLSATAAAFLTSCAKQDAPAGAPGALPHATVVLRDGTRATG